MGDLILGLLLEKAGSSLHLQEASFRSECDLGLVMFFVVYNQLACCEVHFRIENKMFHFVSEKKNS